MCLAFVNPWSEDGATLALRQPQATGIRYLISADAASEACDERSFSHHAELEIAATQALTIWSRFASWPRCLLANLRNTGRRPVTASSLPHALSSKEGCARTSWQRLIRGMRSLSGKPCLPVLNSMTNCANSFAMYRQIVPL